MTGPTTPEQVAWVQADDDFGSRLALIRHRMRWNVKEAARECGVPAATWRLWEEGASPRNLVTIAMTIAARTGADVDWLIKGPSRATLEARAQDTRWYPAHVLGTLPPIPHPALNARPIQHGDSRRRPNGGPNHNRGPARPRQAGQPTRPVPRVKVT